ncbi:hypothetical protein [Dyadobacter crusticola]|uniref:hypothetical protein n=1 Tax=Dyadobacter crusticola TaxID=292407 RepID=UPI0004E1F741|nr:hypothetical protein [Dyadobacter crusticola]
MKIILLLLLISTTVLAQERAQIDVRSVTLHSPARQSAGVLLGASMSDCTEAVGPPNRISDYYSEIEEDTMKVFHYGENQLYFLHDKLESWSALLDFSYGLRQ